MPVSPDRRLLTLDDVIEITSLARSTIYDLVRDGTFPRPIPVGKAGRLKRWRRSDVEWWIERMTRQSDQKPDTASAE